jgi:gamma-glutamyltranspeptidase/glutathione hydrolase
VELITSGPLAAIFARGPVAKEGTTVVNLPLAITLERIGREGSRAFYEGAVAADLLQTAVAAGSPWSASDLADYYVAPREPLRGRWEGYEIATMPPPSAGGLMLLETLALYSRAELRNMSEGTANYSHMVAEAMRGAIADRMRAVGDPAFAPDRSAALLEPARLAARRLHIGYERTHAPPRFELSESGTSHLVVVDAKGNVVSMTTTINNPFGSGVLAAASGVLLNDELRDFTPPETAALFDGAPGPNAPKGKARPVSSMTPTIVFRDGVPVLAAGGSGGLRIAQNVTQAVLNRLAFDKGARRAVAAPRFFAPTTEPSLIYAEADLPPADVQLDLTEKGEQIKAISDNTSAVQMITWSRTSSGGFSLDAAADPRKGGVGLVK